MQLRYFIIDIDEHWRPTLRYYKEAFQARVFGTGSRPTELGSLNLGSFTFTPTKVPRHSDNPRSWRIDCTGASKGKSSGSTNDKLVVEFTSGEGIFRLALRFTVVLGLILLPVVHRQTSPTIFTDCCRWQAALSVCQTGPRKVAEAKALAVQLAEEAQLAAASLLNAENSRKAAAQAEEKRQQEVVRTLQAVNSDLNQVLVTYSCVYPPIPSSLASIVTKVLLSDKL
jgi:hypothetical protein